MTTHKSPYSPCFLIPCYNHGSTIAAVVESLSVFSLPVLVVDDGSNDETKRPLDALSAEEKITLIRLPENQGKGGAVIAGIQQAFAQGFSHAIQIDADGQHDLDAVPTLLQASQSKPNRLISGQPIYDESVPKSRLYGRYVTHIWVWIETLSLSIKDSMCGFGAYPLAQTVDVLNKYNIGKRMDFDIEILVRMYWEGTDIDFVPTRVIYPESGISHFDALWDNAKISRMHARLFFAMLPRIFSLLARNNKRANKFKQASSTDDHWSKRKEQGTRLGIKILLAVYRMFGRKVFDLILKLVMRYYHLTGKSARQASEIYLKQLQQHAKQQSITLPQPLDSYQHLLSFGRTMLDKLAAWQGDFSVDNLTLHGQHHVKEIAEKQQGVVIIGSHLGNIELCRALGRRHSHVKI
ncbi:MAG: glycosyltransferase, partial [Shewanella sp.]